MSGSLLRPLFGVLRLRASQYTHKGVSPLVCGCQAMRNYAQQTQVEKPMSDHDRRLKDFFRCYDLNGDGEITREELFKAMKRAVGYNDVGTNQIVDAIYADCEKEKNDIITFEDFKKGIRIVSFKK